VLERSLRDKAKAFDSIVKLGRTHLMDAVPVRMGQEFSGYAQQIASTIRRVSTTRAALDELPLGGTAVGTGLGAEPKFAPAVIAILAREIGLPLKQAPNLFEALAARDGLVEASGALRAAAVSLTKIANDVRWLGSGPRGAIGELHIPDLQPGSSIMPGKVNPVMSEMLLMVCAQVIGQDATIAWGGAAGNFELNTMMPVMAFSFLSAATVMTNACHLFASRCIDGLVANEARAAAFVEQSMAMATALNPRIGYDAAAALAREAAATGKTVRQLAIEKNLLPADELERLLDPRRMTGA
jgi:fumarate hydratase class II